MPKRILVVDDDRNIGQILHASFSSKGYETIVSRNGEDALERFEKDNPDLVLLDVLLPKMNGWEVCRKLKETENGRKTPVILMSAVYKNYKMQQDAVTKYGADDFLEKPFQLSKLLDKVLSILGPETPPEGEAEIAIEEEELADEETPAADAPEAPDDEPAVAVEEETVAPGPETAPISMEGDFDTISFAELIHAVYVLRKSGYLLVRHGEIEKEIAIKEGYPVSVRTTLEDEYFGNFLVRKRKITEEQRDESVARMKKSRRLQGTILIEMGALSPHENAKFLRLQMREKLFEIFGWRDGIYKFTEDPFVQGDITTLDMSTANVINEGVRQHYDLDRLLPLIDSWRYKYIHPGSNMQYRFQDIELTRREEEIWTMVDGTKTLQEILTSIDLDTERAYQIVYILIVCEMAEFSDASANLSAEMDDSLEADVDVDADFEMAEDEAAPVEEEPVAEEASEEESPAEKPTEGEELEEKPAGKKPRANKAATAKATAPSKEEEEQRQRVLRVYNRVLGGNHFQILGVSDNPTEHETRVAYHKMAKEFHPDRFFGRASEEVRGQVEEIFRLATEAYENLNSQEKIAAYIRKLEGEEEAPKTDSRIEGVKKIIIAEQHFQNGKQYLKEKRFARAAHEFKSAMEISPNEADYVAHYGWALYNIPKEADITAEDAKLFADQSAGDQQFNGREALNRAITINPRSERAYLFMGAIYKMQGLKDFAEKQYEKALICNPSCIEALRELRLIKLQEQKATQKTTLVDKMKGFFKKKS